MTELIRRRRRRRNNGRITKARRRNRNAFIPRGDLDFADSARNFANTLERDAERLGVKPELAAQVEKKVEAYRAALSTALRPISRTSGTIIEKDEARAAAEQVMRTAAHIIRANPDLAASDLISLRLKPNAAGTRVSARSNTRTLLQRAPRLRFLGVRDGASPLVSSGGGMHVLQFLDMDDHGVIRKAKPKGASRLELFVDLVPPGESMPEHPAQRTGRPWYLKSFTRNPIEVEYPVSASGPMMVVYWARWATATGEVGWFSAACPARVEGWLAPPPPLPRDGDAGALPGHSASQSPPGSSVVILNTPYALPAAMDEDAALMKEARGEPCVPPDSAPSLT
jgi:hypothetical protein